MGIHLVLPDLDDDKIKEYLVPTDPIYTSESHDADRQAGAELSEAQPMKGFHS